MIYKDHKISIHKYSIDCIWAAEVDYFTENTDNLYDNVFTVKFYVRAINKEDAYEFAKKIYESEFGVYGKAYAQQSIEDTNALNVYKIRKTN
jgi:hypothetical protein